MVMGSNACDANGQPLEEVDCFKNLGSIVAATLFERDVVHRNEGYRAWGALKNVPSNRGLRIKAKKCRFGGVIVPTVVRS